VDNLEVKLLFPKKEGTQKAQEAQEMRGLSCASCVF
jgi:hypothetical protein